MSFRFNKRHERSKDISKDDENNDDEINLEEKNKNSSQDDTENNSSYDDYDKIKRNKENDYDDIDEYNDYKNERERDKENESRRDYDDHDNYDPRNEESLKNLDRFFYKKNFQIIKIFKMKNRCIFILVLNKKIGKCVLVYIDPSKYTIECQSNNSIVGRDNVHDIELYKINHKHIYEVCDCYPELMEQVKEHRIDIESERNKLYLTHFEQICIQLNIFKKIVKATKSKMSIVSGFSVSFINDENQIELFIIRENIPEKFSKMKTYLSYNLSDFTKDIDSIEFDIKNLYSKFSDELGQDCKELKNKMETKSTIHNINNIKKLLSDLDTKKNHMKNDADRLRKMFQVIRRNKEDIKNKNNNVQNRFKLEKIENTEQETTFFMMEIEDEHFNLLTHELNIMHLIDKQCNNINDYIQYLKKYCNLK